MADQKAPQMQATLGLTAPAAHGQLRELSSQAGVQGRRIVERHRVARALDPVVRLPQALHRPAREREPRAVHHRLVAEVDRAQPGARIDGQPVRCRPQHGHRPPGLLRVGHECGPRLCALADRPEVRFDVGMTLLMAGDREEGMGQLVRAVQLNPAVFREIKDPALSRELRGRLDASGYGAKHSWMFKDTPAEQP